MSTLNAAPVPSFLPRLRASGAPHASRVAAVAALRLSGEHEFAARLERAASARAAIAACEAICAALEVTVAWFGGVDAVRKALAITAVAGARDAAVALLAKDHVAAMRATLEAVGAVESSRQLEGEDGQ